MVARGRSLTGERNHKAKLTAPDVLSIRTSRDAVPKLAQRFGVTPQNITAILQGKTWVTLATAPELPSNETIPA